MGPGIGWGRGGFRAAGRGNPFNMEVPAARGPISEFVVDALRGPAGEVGPGPGVEDDPVRGDDFHLALYLCYELHYRAIGGVDERWEWEPSLIAFRRGMESRFEAATRELAGPVKEPPEAVPDALVELARRDSGPSLSRYLAKDSSPQHFREFVIHRSAYHLKEADPHSLAIPRLSGAAKAALVEIQADEYGGGREPRMHATLFRNTMRALGLDERYGAYVGVLPGVTLATVNLMSLFGLHRRLRGAIAGHLAMFELTSSIPNRRYGDGLRRLGFGKDAREFFDEHVEADSVHDMIAVHDLVGGLLASEPHLAADVMLGGRALLALEAEFAGYLLDRWQAGDPSLVSEAPGGSIAGGRSGGTRL